MNSMESDSRWIDQTNKEVVFLIYSFAYFSLLIFIFFRKENKHKTEKPQNNNNKKSRLELERNGSSTHRHTPPHGF